MGLNLVLGVLSPPLEPPRKLQVAQDTAPESTVSFRVSRINKSVMVGCAASFENSPFLLSETV